MIIIINIRSVAAPLFIMKTILSVNVQFKVEMNKNIECDSG